MNKEKQIITDYEKLSERCDEIDVRKENSLMRDIILALKDTMKENNLLHLSAPQIGYNKRIFVIKFGQEYKTYINPMIVSSKNISISEEICSSIPGKKFIRPRSNSINVSYQTPLGKVESKQFIGVAAVAFQHCQDHLDGLLLNDVGLEIDDDFDKATDDERAEVIRMYMESLDMRANEIKDVIAESEELTKINDAIKFMESVAKGETSVKYEKISVSKDETKEDKKDNKKKGVKENAGKHNN